METQAEERKEKLRQILQQYYPNGVKDQDIELVKRSLLKSKPTALSRIKWQEELLSFISELETL